VLVPWGTNEYSYSARHCLRTAHDCGMAFKGSTVMIWREINSDLIRKTVPCLKGSLSCELIRPCSTCWIRRRGSCRGKPPTGNSAQRTRSPALLASRRKHASHCAVHPGRSPRGTSLATPQPPPARWNDNTGYCTGHGNLHHHANVGKFENAMSILL
jgi:hypothetical protein